MDLSGNPRIQTNTRFDDTNVIKSCSPFHLNHYFDIWDQHIIFNSDIFYYNAGCKLPDEIVFPSTKGRLPKKHERFSDRYHIFNYIKQGVAEIASITSQKRNKYTTILSDFSERVIANTIEAKNIDYATLNELDIDNLFNQCNKNINRFKDAFKNKRRKLKRRENKEEVKQNKFDNKESEIQIMADEVANEAECSTSRRDRLANYLINDAGRNLPLQIMKQIVEGTKFKKYYNYFKFFYQWYLPKAATFNNMEAGMNKFIALLKSGEIRQKRNIQLKSSGINNYIKSYNCYVKASGLTSIKQIKHLRVEDRNEQVIILPDLQTQVNMEKLRTKYASKEQLTAFNLAFYFGLRATEIASIHDCEFKKVAKKESTPEHYVVTTRKAKGNVSKPVRTFNQYMIKYIDDKLKQKCEYWFFGSSIPKQANKTEKDILTNKSNVLSLKVARMCKNIFGVNTSLHDVRRTFCSNMYEKGIDSGVMQSQMRLKNNSTTMLYVDEQVKKKREITELVDKMGIFDEFEVEHSILANEDDILYYDMNAKSKSNFKCWK